MCIVFHNTVKMWWCKLLLLNPPNEFYSYSKVSSELHPNYNIYSAPRCAVECWCWKLSSSTTAQQHNSGNQQGIICIKAVVNTTTSTSAAWEQCYKWRSEFYWILPVSGWRGGVQCPGEEAGGGRAVQPGGLRHLGGEHGYNTRALKEPSRSYTTIKNLLRHYDNLAPNLGKLDIITVGRLEGSLRR